MEEKDDSVQQKHFGIEMQVNNEVMGMKNIVKKSWDESQKMWEIAAPAMMTAVTQFSIGFLTSAFVGHLGEVELAAVSVVQNVIEAFVDGVMLGMGSALETLCGQVVGAGQLNMLGIYMQRSWIITGVTALVLTPFYVFASPLLKLLRQDKDISRLAGKYSIWVIPQLFAYAINYPIQKFLQAQSRDFTFFFSFFCLDDNSLEVWYFTMVILMVGWLENPEIAVDAISICMNLQLWTLMIALGFNAAISVRVSNELGAGNPKAAKFSMVAFTRKPVVMKEASKLGYFLAATIFLNCIQPVLHGVAVGAGWQFLVAFINIGCYYIIGLPIGAVLGYKLKLGVKGIWTGMLAGYLLQIVTLIFILLRTSWHKEAVKAEEHIKTWGGSDEPQQSSSENNMNG
ncbi:hypothetical protein GH714_011344 [Hevea brasiliensis]|uniref:Protein DETOXIFICATION n=1 Tax=Hevea brasiliensis TaxID=3981 RepID=A0A6A6L119_HEVBR|nr:hypothetical protein GH714_011344 [Hevea brasiliensis]